MAILIVLAWIIGSIMGTGAVATAAYGIWLMRRGASLPDGMDA